MYTYVDASLLFSSYFWCIGAYDSRHYGQPISYLACRLIRVIIVLVLACFHTSLCTNFPGKISSCTSNPKRIYRHLYGSIAWEGTDRSTCRCSTCRSTQIMHKQISRSNSLCACMYDLDQGVHPSICCWPRCERHGSIARMFSQNRERETT